MPLTLRPTGLSRDPNAKDDWNVYDGGSQPVGRIYEVRTPPAEGARWAWFLQVCILKTLSTREIVSLGHRRIA